MPRISLKTFAFATALLALTSISRADWVAFNDHVPGTLGTQTHPNTTTLKIPVVTNGPVATNLFLKNIANGTNLPVTLTISRSGTGINYNGGGANPGVTTPLYIAFSTNVYFGSGADATVEITNSTITYAFSNLNSAKRYSFIGGANRGLPVGNASNKFTKIEILGATSFVAAHSARVITSAQAPADLTAGQAAVNFGTNTVSGDLVDWENIDPGADGTFSIVCSRYQGFVPNGGRSNGTNAYAITGIRLEELPGGPPVITSQPQDVTVNSGQTATFSVTASGLRPLSYQWYRNGSMIASATNTSYTTPVLGLIDGGTTYSVTVFNSIGSLPSRAATVTVVSSPVDLISVTNTLWKYNQSGNDLGVDWRDVAYNDTAWPSGRGVFALETDNQTVIPFINTPLSLTSAGGRVTTFYFRTHINLDDPTAVSITASNLVDDGSIVYVNGQEVNRQNLPAAPAVVRFNTTATAAIEAAWTGYSIPSTYFVSGDNVIAVEVHDASSTSSDVDFGFRLISRDIAPTPIVITNNPVDLRVSDAAPATFSVGFNGSQAKYQWYKWVNDVPVAVPGATAANYTIPNTVFSDSGFYFVVITNLLSSAQSASALLTVYADTNAPTLVAADGTASSTNVVVSFSEVVAALSATNITNYRITNLNTGTLLPITKAVINKATNVILTTSARVAGANYLLVVNNVRDISLAANAIAPNSAIPVTSLLTFVGLEQPGWQYYEPLPDFSSPDPGAGWNQLIFPSPTPGWVSGRAGLFVYDPVGIDLPGARGTDLSGAPASYYRFLFNSTISPVGAKLTLKHVVDDAMVAYMNGSEMARFNMTNGPVATNTPAATNVGVAIAIIDDLSPMILRQGSNLLAAEMHGATPNAADPDAVFGAELTAVVSSYVTGAVMITSGPRDISVVENQPLTLDFTAVAASIVQWRTNGTAIPGATNPVFSLAAVPPSWNGKLFSVAVSNSLGGVISTNARLTVVTDTTLPSLRSAVALSQTSISASFSEPLSLTSATNVLNYRVTNSAGPNLTISGVVLTNGGSNVVLTVSPMSSGIYTLLVSGLKDLATVPNTILSNSAATLGVQLTIPIEAVWRYYTNATDLTNSWRARTYNDSLWPTGPGLIADETAAMPEPVRTPISRLDNGTYHYTFYFRYHFNMPFGASTATVTFRHIIDDGALMYINGAPFHSFNMTVDPTTVSFDSQATAAIGDGAYSGPYTATFTNLLAGDNVIAVEVHQNGTASSDLTFGAAFTIDVPSTPLLPPVPNLQIAKSQGTNVVVSWPGTGFALERKTVLAPGAFWAPATNQGPYTVAPKTSTNQATFYQLRRR